MAQVADAELAWEQAAVEVDLGFDEPNGDEATWWHTYALPFLRVHYAMFI